MLEFEVLTAPPLARREQRLGSINPFDGPEAVKARKLTTQVQLGFRVGETVFSNHPSHILHAAQDLQFEIQQSRQKLSHSVESLNYPLFDVRFVGDCVEVLNLPTVSIAAPEPIITISSSSYIMELEHGLSSVWAEISRSLS